MLYHLLTRLTGACKYCGVFNVFNYITFRSAGAAVTAMLIAFLIGPAVIARLRVMKVRQGVREGTPDSHQTKGNTPTMGGVIILIAGLVPTLLWARLTNRYIWTAILVTAWMGAIGFLDDYLKLKQQRAGEKNRGLIERYKLAGQVAIGILLGAWLWLDPLSSLPGASTTIPFYKYVLVVPIWAWLYVPWVAFVLTGVSNSVSLTDGLDGLASGLSAIAFATFGLFAYVIGRSDTSHYLQIYYLPGAGELAVFAAAVIGALIGFLWYNTFPAQVFMGDTGALALGGALGLIAVIIRQEIVLAIAGGIFVVEAVSVILQVASFQLRGRRVFAMAPIHHHYELKGWPEPRIIVRFWIVSILLALVSLSLLKLR